MNYNGICGTRVLVIGNGFDIAHSLLTSYFDFLYACCLVTKREFKGQEWINGEKKPYNQEKFKIKKLVINDFSKYKDDIINNHWINYFLSIIDKAKPTWIDFESKIKEIIELDYTKNDKIDWNSYYTLTDGANAFNTKTLIKDLNSLINLLDQYLKIATRSSRTICYKEIVQFNPTHVVNFNYTDTYSKQYNSKIDIDFVHGKLSKRSLPNSIVLGFNETDCNDNDVDYADFLKYYQMSKNDIIVNVFDILKDKNYDIMFFGHSLDETDANIIQPLISKAKKVYILSHSEEAKAEKIKKMMKMFHRDTFIDYSFKSNRKLNFCIQSKAFENKAIHRAQKFIYSILNKNSIESDDELYETLRICSHDIFDLPIQTYAVLLNCIFKYDKSGTDYYSKSGAKEEFEYLRKIVYNKFGDIEKIRKYLSDETYDYLSNPYFTPKIKTKNN